MSIDEPISHINDAATELQSTEFRRPRTPGEWQYLRNRPARRYAKLLNAVQPFIEAFASAPFDERVAASAKLSLDALAILRTFAHAASVLAVRRRSPELIAEGLKALAVLGGVDDIRDLAFYLAALNYSADKLGVNAVEVFGGVALLATSADLRREMRGFPQRHAEAKSLSAFRLREIATNEGFDLVQDDGWRF